MYGKPLTGRTVLITGASGGLGEHFTKLCAKAGANVVAAARRKDRLQRLVAIIAAEGGRSAAVELDVSDEASIVAAFNQAESCFGPIDTVIANAGISSPGMAIDLPIEEWDAIMAVNTRGVFLTARQAARRMMALGSRDNRIVLIASIGGLKPLPALAAYSSSKAAVVMLGQSLAREWMNKDINVNVVCPGYITTDLNSDWFDSERGQKQVAGFPRRRLMSPEQLDDIILFLAGPASAAVTGSIFKLDDGQTL